MVNADWKHQDGGVAVAALAMVASRSETRRRLLMHAQTTLKTGSRFLRRTLLVASAAALLIIAGLSVSRTVAASNDEGPHRGCSLATLKGRYLFASSGVLSPPAFGVTQSTPAADAGFHLFNGDGTGTDIVTFNIGGATVLENAVTPISYTVNRDCTGTYTALVPNGPSFDLFIAPDGEEFASIPTAPRGNYGATIDHRVSSR